MIATYQNLYEQLGESTAANEDAKMSFDPRPVSLEEYNQAVQNPAAADEEVYEEAEETAEKGPEADTQSQQESGEVSVSEKRKLEPEKNRKETGECIVRRCWDRA